MSKINLMLENAFSIL